MHLCLTYHACIFVFLMGVEVGTCKVEDQMHTVGTTSKKGDTTLANCKNVLVIFKTML